MWAAHIRHQTIFRSAIAGRGLVLVQRSVYIMQVIRLSDKISRVYAQGFLLTPFVGITYESGYGVLLGKRFLIRKGILERIVVPFGLRLR